LRRHLVVCPSREVHEMVPPPPPSHQNTTEQMI
jgi:hypothetical protein